MQARLGVASYLAITPRWVNTAFPNGTTSKLAGLKYEKLFSFPTSTCGSREYGWKWGLPVGLLYLEAFKKIQELQGC